MNPDAARGASGRAGVGTVILTGATGLLGSHLVPVLDEQAIAATLVGLANVPDGHDRWVRCDLTDESAVAELIATRRPRLVIHAAALTNVDTCEDDPALAAAVNAEAPGRLAQLTSEAGGRFVQISTDSVFDGRGGPYVEDDRTVPLNEYARSKLAGELAVAAGAPNHLVLRVNFFGRSPTGAGLADWLVRELSAGHAITGFDDVIFSPLDAATLSEAIVALAFGEQRGTLHLGASDAVSKFAFAQLVAEAHGLDPQLVRAGALADAKLTAPRPLDTSLDSSRAAAVLGRPLPTVAECVARLAGVQRK